MDDVVSAITRALGRHRFRFANERELQAGIAQVFDSEGIRFDREARLGDAGTIDFLVTTQTERVGVEIKVQGSLPEVTRQVHRYLQHDAIDALVLVTTRAGLARLPTSMSGKKVHALHLVTGAF